MGKYIKLKRNKLGVHVRLLNSNVYTVVCEEICDAIGRFWRICECYNISPSVFHSMREVVHYNHIESALRLPKNRNWNDNNCKDD